MQYIHSLPKVKHGEVKCQKMDKYCCDWHEMLQVSSYMFIHGTKQRITYIDKKYWSFVKYKMTSYLGH